MIFENREQAARLLTGRMHHLRGSNPLILAIPRGGVPMGRIIADALGGELGIVLVHKLGSPSNPEAAIGAVDEYGTVHLYEEARNPTVTEEYLAWETERQTELLRRKREFYEPFCTQKDPRGRIVVVLDDGVATGSTMVSALQSVLPHNPRSLIAAMAVATPSALAKINAVARESICLHVTDQFMAISQFFVHFPPVEDDDVIRLLAPGSLLL